MTALLIGAGALFLVSLVWATILDGHAWMRRAEPETWQRPRWAEIPRAELVPVSTTPEPLRVTAWRIDN